MTVPAALEVMFGSYLHTEPLKAGDVRSDKLTLNIADVVSAPAAFRQVVALKYDVAELSVPTFLIARSKGVPLVLLPADLFNRAKPPELIYRSARGLLRPRDLQGKRIGVAYYTATTSIWMLTLLSNAGVNPAAIRWVAMEDSHVVGYQDPPNVERLAGKTLVDFLNSGEVDAIVTTASLAEPQFRGVSFEVSDGAGQAEPLFPNLESHHMLVVKADVTRRHPEVIQEMWRMLLEARAIVLGPANTRFPYGLSANRAHLEVMIDACFRLNLIGKRPRVEELFDAVTIALPASA